MALIDPTAPLPFGWNPPEWDSYISQFAAPDPYAPPPIDQQIAPPGAPVVGEVPQAGLAQAAVPTPAVDPPGPGFIEMPEEFVGRPSPLIEMPEDFVGRAQAPGNEQLPIEADAVSDAGYKPPDGTPLGAGPLPTDIPLEQAAGRPAMLSDDEHGQLLAREAISDPEASLRRRTAEDKAHEDRVRAEQLDLEREQLSMAEGRHQIAMEARNRDRQRRAQIDADAQKLADINQDGWMESRSPLQHVAGFLSAVIGGLMQSQTGGRNLGLESIQHSIDQHIEIQKANLAAKRAELGRRSQSSEEQYALDMEDAQALATQEKAAWEFSVRQAQARQAQVDPRGTSYRRYADAIVEMEARKQAADDKAAQQRIDRDIKIGDYKLRAREQKRKEQETNAKMRAAASRAVAGKTVKPDDVVQSPEHFQKVYGKAPPLAMSQNQYEQWAKTGKVVEEYGKAQRENSPEELERQFAVSGVVDDTGEKVLLRDPAKVAKVMAAADQIIDLTDRLITAREKYGWSSDLMQSPEWREMRSDMSSLLLEKKNLDELGVIAGPDMDLMTKAIGTGDPTGVHDPTPGLRRIRKTTTDKVNSTIRHEANPKKGRTIDRWEKPAPPPLAPKTPEDAALQRVLAFDPEHSEALADIAGELGIERRGDSTGEMQQAAKALRENEGMTPSIRATIDRLAAVVASRDQSITDAQRAAAAVDIDKIAKEAESGAVREYATRKGLPDLSSIPAGD